MRRATPPRLYDASRRRAEAEYSTDARERRRGARVPRHLALHDEIEKPRVELTEQVADLLVHARLVARQASDTGIRMPSAISASAL